MFFCSGACGLIYQVLWLRLLSLTFGVTVYAASTVLAAFMAGLALGSMLAGRVLSRVQRPLLVFGAAEILIGLAALATPFELQAATRVYATLYQHLSGSLFALTLARLVSGFVVLLLPTMLMGLTLPVLSASAIVRGTRVGSRIGALYAINTAGAVGGAILAGFYLIGGIGIQKSFLLAASINVVVGVLACLLSRTVDESKAVEPTPSAQGAPATSQPPVSAPAAIAGIIAISGLAALALEIVWFRTLVLFLDATTYAFTTMLATVLVGIAVGGAIAARLLRRERDWTHWLFAIQWATSLAVLGSAIFLARSYEAGWRTSDEVPASVAAILPATLLMGMSFPIAMRLGLSSHSGASTTARRVGRLYAMNVAGAIAGSLLGGFVLLPWLGSRRALITTAALYGLSAVLLTVRHPARARLLATAALGAVLFAVTAVRVPDPFTAAFNRRYGRDMREFWREEGAQTSVSVHASLFRRSLYLDGLHQANDTPDMVRLHRIIGHLPMVLHPAPHDVLVVGLGGGATAGAVSQYPGSRVQIVELSESVRRAAPFFSHISYDVLNQPNVRIRVDDGRNFLLLSGERFDVITADIIQPSHAGAGNVYSREYFRLVRRALEDNGLALQWIGHRPATEYKLIMRTFLDVFPDATLWFDAGLMVGSKAPLRIDPSTLDAKRRDPRIRAALDDIGLVEFETLRSWYTAGPEEMRRFVGAGPILTDDQPLVEYHRSLPTSTAPLDLTGLSGDVSRITPRN